MEYVIETKTLTKKYGEKLAVNGISLHVRKGDIYGLIGKNGAGKTTLMKLLLGLTTANGGEIKLFGSTDLDRARRKIGSLIEAPALYKNETAFENMKRFAILAPTSDEEIRNLLTLVGLGNVGSKKAGEFSLGMKQRLGIAIALLGNPELLILDEPINGLDPAGIKEIRDMILELNSRKEVYLSKLISALISTTVMFVIVEIAAFAIGTAFFGLGEVGNIKFLALIGTQYVVAMANITLAFAVASVIRKNGGAIAGIILAPMLVGVVTGLADSFLKFEDFSLTSLWLSNFLFDVSVLTVSAERIITCLVGSIIYIPLFVIAGLYFNKKIEL